MYVASKNQLAIGKKKVNSSIIFVIIKKMLKNFQNIKKIKDQN